MMQGKLLLGSTLMLAVGALSQHHGDGGAAGDLPPDKLWKDRCAGCHVVPDPTFEADRAYIAQVHLTA